MWHTHSKWKARKKKKELSFLYVMLTCIYEQSKINGDDRLQLKSATFFVFTHGLSRMDLGKAALKFKYIIWKLFLKPPAPPAPTHQKTPKAHEWWCCMRGQLPHSQNLESHCFTFTVVSVNFLKLELGGASKKDICLLLCSFVFFFNGTANQHCQMNEWMNGCAGVRYNPFQLLFTINNMICITEEESPPGGKRGWG